MRIKLLVSRAVLGPPQDAGDEIDVPDAEAIRMIEAEQAVPVRAKTPERAVQKRKPEKAAKK